MASCDWWVSEDVTDGRGFVGRRQGSGADELVTRQPANQPPQFEGAEGSHDVGGREARASDKLVDSGRLTFKLAQERALLIRQGQLGGVADRWFLGRGADLADQRAKLFENDR